MTAQQFAHRVSIAFIPPVVATFVISVLVRFWEHGGIFHQSIVWLTAVASAGGLQIVYVLYLKRMEVVSAYDVPEREDRNHPYLVSAGISLGGLVALQFLNASVFLWGLLWCFTVNTLILYVINRYWKISAHMMGLTGPLVFLWPLFGVWLALALPIVLLLGWARIATGSHTFAQVLAGAIVGVVLTLLQVWLLLDVVLPLMRG
jgi:membrane-associated phospholipid phosphatase